MIDQNSGYRTKPGETNQCGFCSQGLGVCLHRDHYPDCEVLQIGGRDLIREVVDASRELGKIPRSLSERCRQLVMNGAADV